MSDRILSLNGWLALAMVFSLPALESSAFVGFLFPGEIAVILGGVLAYDGRVQLPAVIIAAVLGAIVGDTVGYMVGRRWGRKILRSVGGRVPFLRHRIDAHLQTAQAYVQRRGGAAVFFGRFTAALRVMVPGLAGMAEIPYGRFAFFNAAGGLVWGTAFVLLGYFAGAAWERVAADAAHVGLAILGVVLAALVLERVLGNVREHGERVPDRLARTRPVAWVRRTYPGGSAWLARRIDTRSPTGFLLSLAIVAGVSLAWLFGGLTQDVVAHEEAATFDPAITRFAVEHRTGSLTVAMKTVTWLGSSAVLVPTILLVGGYFLLRRRDPRPLALLGAAYVCAEVSYRIAKVAVARPRPPVALHLTSVSGFSFPSGHATAAFACWGTVAWVLASGRRPSIKAVAWMGAGIVAVLVAISRVYLGVHWFTDVAAGSALGGCWVCLVGSGALLAAWAPLGGRGPASDAATSVDG